MVHKLCTYEKISKTFRSVPEYNVTLLCSKILLICCLLRNFFKLRLLGLWLLLLSTIKFRIYSAIMSPFVSIMSFLNYDIVFHFDLRVSRVFVKCSILFSNSMFPRVCFDTLHTVNSPAVCVYTEYNNKNMLYGYNYCALLGKGQYSIPNNFEGVTCIHALCYYTWKWKKYQQRPILSGFIQQYYYYLYVIRDRERLVQCVHGKCVQEFG